MGEIIGRCGFRCDLCMAYKGNGSGSLHQLSVAAGWFRYYEYMIHPSRVFCEGCLPTGSRLFKFKDSFDSVCDCVSGKKLENCALCDNYPCPDIEDKMSACELIKERYAGKIHNEEYLKFISPYDPRTVLEKERAKLTEY